jgi:hypothetical protein
VGNKGTSRRRFLKVGVAAAAFTVRGTRWPGRSHHNLRDGPPHSLRVARRTMPCTSNQVRSKSRRNGSSRRSLITVSSQAPVALQRRPVGDGRVTQRYGHARATALARTIRFDGCSMRRRRVCRSSQRTGCGAAHSLRVLPTSVSTTRTIERAPICTRVSQAVRSPVSSLPARSRSPGKQSNSLVVPNRRYLESNLSRRLGNR